MTQQPWLAASFAAIMIVTAGYCLTRLALSWRQARPTDRAVDTVHVLMGVAMAGMLVPRLRVIPAGGWGALFAGCAALFLWRVARSARGRTRTAGTPSAGTPSARTPSAGTPAAGTCAGRTHRPAHDGQHLLGCAAMVYMLAAMMARPAGGGVGGVGAVAMSGVAGAPAPALVLAVALIGCVVWSADRISTLAPVAVLASRATGALSLSATVGPADTDTGSGPGTGLGTGPAIAVRGVPLSPRLAACCEIAMGVTMGYMLIVAI